ncbi:MAG TPA: hypothetical protein PKE30_16195, partial [Niabella sp.]|nr:hypothetical protein [Niabella sp.]
MKFCIRKKCFVTLGCILALFLSGILRSQAQSVTITQPTCEYRTNPVGLDVRVPRLSWKLVSK